MTVSLPHCLCMHFRIFFMDADFSLILLICAGLCSVCPPLCLCPGISVSPLIFMTGSVSPYLLFGYSAESAFSSQKISRVPLSLPVRGVGRVVCRACSRKTVLEGAHLITIPRICVALAFPFWTCLPLALPHFAGTIFFFSFQVPLQPPELWAFVTLSSIFRVNFSGLCHFYH